MLVTFMGRTPVLSSRTRTLHDWSLFDWGNGEYSAEGWVTSGNEPGDGEAVRHTRTSPISHREGTNVVITQSGSRYTLLAPRDRQDPAQIVELFDE
jgi:hypothetical protein